MARSKSLEERQSEMRARQMRQAKSIPVSTSPVVPPRKPVAPAARDNRRWLFVKDVTAETGWSKSTATRHLERMFEAGDEGVIDCAIGQKKRKLQISREAFELLLRGMQGQNPFWDQQSPS